MLVDVICLRKLGERIPRVVLREVAPIRGDLAISVHRDTWHQRASSLAVLIDTNKPAGNVLLPNLDRVAVSRMRGNSFVLVGIEGIAKYKKGSYDFYRQSWWCTVVLDSAIRADKHDPPDDEEVMALALP